MTKKQKLHGGVLSSVDLRDYKIKSSDLLYVEFPKTFEIEMKHVIRYQKSNSCTAQAVRTVLEYFDKNRYNLSSNFIYGLKRKLFCDEGYGEPIREALIIVKDYGDPRHQYCFGDDEVDKVYEIAEASFNNEVHMKDAYKHRIKEYIKLRSEKEIKYALMNYGPVVMCTKWYDNLAVSDVTGNLVFDKTSKWSYHTFVVYGWNEYGWMCQNSWGQFWGKNGLFNLSYSHKLLWSDVYALVDDETLDSTIENVEIIKPGSQSQFINSILKIANKLINWIKLKYMSA